MPGVYYGPGGYQGLASTVAALAKQVQALSAQQQMVFSNQDGVPVMVFGRIPGSDPSAYGLQTIDASTHAPMGFFGQNSDGVCQQEFYDSAGNVTTTIDFEGIHIYDDTGTEHVRLGLLNSSPALYGLGVLPQGGSELQQVAGSLPLAAGTVTDGTATSWTALPSPNSLSFEVGPSGEFTIQVEATIGWTTGSGQSVSVGYALDGNTPAAVAILSGTIGNIQATVVGSNGGSDLSPGTHSVELFYEVYTDSVPVNIATSMFVTPL